MSIPLALIGQNTPGSAYVVAAPRASDALSATLRSAYGRGGNDTEPFADIIAILDTIEAKPPPS